MMRRAERRFSESRDYGEKLNYDPEWKGPLKIERKPTDVGFLIALAIYFAVWIGNGFYAFYTGDIMLISRDLHLDYLFSIYTDVIYITLGFSSLGTCLGFIYLLLLKYHPKTMFFTSFFFNFALPLIFIIVLVQAMKDEVAQDAKIYIIAVFAIFMIVMLVIMGSCVIAFYKKILIACEVIKESAKVVTFFPSSFGFPILPFLWYLLATAFTACTWACLYENSSTQNGDRPYYLYLLHGINFYGFWWMVSFVHAFSKMVLAGTFATWYWTANRNQISNWVILKFMYITMRFHLGTLAFGSLIIAMIQGIRYLLRLAYRRSVEDRDWASAIFFRCFECMCEIMEEYVEYFNTNAYIMCTMHGDNFIKSGKSAYNLLMRNPMRIWAISCVTNTITFMGVVVVVLLSVLLTYAYCHNMNPILMYSAMGLVLVTTSLVSAEIFAVLDIAVDTIFLCVLEDNERNNGSRERPYFMTPKMRQLLMRDDSQWSPVFV